MNARPWAITLAAGLAASVGLGADLHVGAGHPYANLHLALSAANPGDTIVLHGDGVTPYNLGPYVVNDANLTIRGEGGPVTLEPNPGALPGPVLIIELSADPTPPPRSFEIVNVDIANGVALDPLNTQQGGGGISVERHPATTAVTLDELYARNIVFHDNTAGDAMTSKFLDGGAVFAVGTDVYLQGCEFYGNRALVDGGAVFVSGGVLDARLCRFDGNAADAAGGAIWNADGPFTLAGCRFTGNAAHQSIGGAVFAGGITPVVSVYNSSFMSNSATDPASGYGGGIYLASGAMTLTNTLFANNQADEGGALWIDDDAAADLLNVTMTKNQAASLGAGVYADYNAGAWAWTTIQNSIVWQNPGTQPLRIDPASTVRYSDIDGGFVGGTAIFNTDPVFIDPAIDDFRLHETSPMVDAGDTTVYSGPLSDLDGNHRGTECAAAPNTGLCHVDPIIDIGAIEWVPPLYSPADINQDGVLNLDDLDLFIYWFLYGYPYP